MEKETKELSLVQRMLQVMSEVEWIEKRGKNTMQNYNYAQEADVTDHVRKSMTKHGIVLQVEYKNKEFSQIQYGQNKTAQVFQCEGHFTLINSDKPDDKLTCVIPGHAMDSGDKAVWKCLTGIGKYFLMKTFMIPTGDDPENDSDSDRIEPNKTSAVPPQARKALEGGGFKVNNETTIYILRPGPEDHEAKILFDNSVGVGRMKFFDYHQQSGEQNVYVSMTEGKSAAFKRCLVKKMTLVD